MHFLMDLFYESLYFPLGMLMVFTHGLRVAGTRNVPQTGPVLLIANHQSYLDIVSIGLAVHRRVLFLAKLSLFQNKFLAFILRLFGTIPVDLEGFSRAGLEGILSRLKSNKMVLVFPEGERTRDGQLNELKPGVTLLIKKSRIPIVPIGIAGLFEAWPRTQKFPSFSPPFFSWSRKRIAIAIGEPLDGAIIAELPREEMMKKLALELSKVVARAKKLRGS
jgi:1-acyl-sn-glycerol-3-phosphate acyltransferase